ncbi:protealysin inhibitor emfourin [Curtobacterium sp. MCBA15_008]|uniref:protealysin inhibitor emfourin n=1 Tax=Curtobacterium sp. MCBA15_008 TaxID=1898736 RepID=UPI0008DD43C3|nr:protealysin inhibitor emfourin [Curtobacterium sp. MCBA15_008]OII05377.1 hypothetical protein BIU96_06960 [Curtobacterium sp. MCBA15_008]
MHIDVRRSGGFAGTTRRWQLDTDTCSDPDDWATLLGALPQDAPAAAAPVPDDFTWTITVAQTTVTIPGRRLDGPWADLVARVRSEGDPS